MLCFSSFFPPSCIIFISMFFYTFFRFRSKRYIYNKRHAEKINMLMHRTEFLSHCPLVFLDNTWKTRGKIYTSICIMLRCCPKFFICLPKTSRTTWSLLQVADCSSRQFDMHAVIFHHYLFKAWENFSLLSFKSRNILLSIKNFLFEKNLDSFDFYINIFGEK